MKAQIDIPMEQIEAFCKKYQIVEFSLFGSVLRDDFRPDSDVDVLVIFQKNAPHYGMFDMVRMEQELQELLNRHVDLIEKEAVRKSENYIRRQSILESAEVIYAA